MGSYHRFQAWGLRKTMNSKILHNLLILLTISVLLSGSLWAENQKTPQQQREQAMSLMKDGHYKDAYRIFRHLVLNTTDNQPEQVGSDLSRAIQNLNQLGQQHEIDDLLEKAINTHNNNWNLLNTAAREYLSVNHYGYLIAGKFERGYHRGGGNYVSSHARDVVRAMQLYQRAIQLADKQAKEYQRAQLYKDFASVFINQGFRASWQLQLLTDLTTLPDYQDNNAFYQGRQMIGSPATADGKPVFFKLPETFDSAGNDGERWYWLLEKAMQINPALHDEVTITRAGFFHQLYGVQTLQNFLRPLQEDSEGKKDSVYSVRNLGEDETIARLATGITRFKLPDEYNYIRLFQSLAENSRSSQRLSAVQYLAAIFENRQQYPKAASYWQRAIDSNPNTDYYENRLHAIIDDWGRFETGQPQVAGDKAKLWFRFRNGKNLDIEISRINIQKLLSDTKDYIESNPQLYNYRKVDIQNIGYRLVVENESQYIDKEVASWREKLKPYPDHFDRRTEITTPVKQAGAYLVKASFMNGNTSRIILWLNDTVIVRKYLDNELLYFVADAKTGKPVEGIKLDFFGYKRVRADLPKPLNKVFHKMEISQFNRKTDASGMLITSEKEQSRDLNWLVTAEDRHKRLAYLGFDHIWHREYHHEEYNQQRAIVITDRPVYRPEHVVKFKIWLRQAAYTNIDQSLFANKDVLVYLHDPKGEKIWEKRFHTDAFGGLAGEYALPANATLGVYNLSLPHYYRSYNSGQFRVEEYKKPEFEVALQAPDKPVQLGDRVDIKLSANYYYGQPVSKATVKYKIFRYEHSEQWYPYSRWDWLYGNGYWWSAYDYGWYPGFKRWGCIAPWPFWLPQRDSAPELVAENTLAIPANGELHINLDTQLAKQIYGNKDHRYEIQAEVTDASRRTITGATSLLVTRDPYKVYAWVDKGYYQGGDTVKASFKAQTPQKNSVTGEGQVTLYKINYNNKGTPEEKELQNWDVTTNERGEVEQSFVVTREGQYRVALTVKDSQGRQQTGAYLFNVIGTDKSGESLRFNPLEVIPDRREYRIGNQANILINTQQQNSTILFFERPANGVYRKPKLLTVNGQRTKQQLDITRDDMPNIFVEALTIHNGKVHTEIREIFIPPEKRTLDVKVTSIKPAYKPGEKAKLLVKVTDEDGTPVSGNTVLTVYDKAVEYISGGSNVPEIRKHFWSWRRHHTLQQLTNVDKYFSNLVPRDDKQMQSIGVLGGLLGQDKKEESGLFARLDMAEGDAVMEAAEAAPSVAAAKPKSRSGKLDNRELKKQLRQKGGRKDANMANTEQWQTATVRKQFADTAFWTASVQLDHKGVGHIEFNMPENLTAWSVRAWSMYHGTRVGAGQTEIKTYKNLLLRMQTPRFFVEKDEVVLSANIHNYTKQTQRIKASLELEGNQLVVLEGKDQIINIQANGEKRVDWRVKVNTEGEAIIRMHALTKTESDAMEMRFPVYVHGMDKMQSYTGSVAHEQSSRSFTINIPQARRIDSTQFRLQYSPTLAGAMIDALPYLVDYPYGCTEQTLSRFLPTVITQNVLLNMGVNLQSVRQQHNNLNSQELGDPDTRRKQWRRWLRNPVFDNQEVARMSDAGLQRLIAMQISDGGWGWFSGTGEYSSPHTTAYVVHGLQIARENKLAVPSNVLQRGLQWLQRYLDKRVDEIKEAEERTPPVTMHTNNLDAFVYMVLADSNIEHKSIQDYLYRDRTELSVYAKAMLALAFHKQGQSARVEMLKRNIEQYLVEDSENETAYLELPNNHYWWYWYGSEMEAHAYYLKLLARTGDSSRKASWLVKYLLNNRKHSTYWNSTRDTAIVIEAFAEYLAQSKEHTPDMALKIFVDNTLYKTVIINRSNLFSYDSNLLLQGKQLKSGEHTIRIEKSGKGAIYYNAYLSYFSLEDYIKKTGLEIKIDRQYYKLERIDAKTAKAGAHGQATEHAIEKYHRIPISDMQTLKSGDLVEVELVIQSKNDYEYLVFEDMKPAGFEAVEMRSGYNGNAMGAYVEFRDERVSFFVRQLARGKHSVSYRLRAEIPGKFSALPAHGYAMYAPELKANADEIKLRVIDSPMTH